MSFFGPSEPYITKQKFQRVRDYLYDRHFSEDQLNKVEELFAGPLSGANPSYPGIRRRDIEAAIAWLKANTSKHHFSKDQISLIEEALLKYLGM